jgi:lipoprotein-releasing system permease protein
MGREPLTRKVMGRGPYEVFLGWRYLFRRRGGLGAPVATVLSLLGLLAGQLALFQFSQVKLGALLTVPSAIVLCFSAALNFFSMFTTVSIVSVALGVAALTVVLSVMSGFQTSFKQKVLGVNAHVLVMKYGRDFSEYRDVMKTASTMPHVTMVAPFTFDEMLLSSGRGTAGALVKGIDPTSASAVLDVGEHLEKGRLADLAAPAGEGPRPMFVGRELAKKLKVKVGDTLRLVIPNTDFQLGDQPSGAGDAATREFRVAGIFYAGFDEYDRRLAYVNLKDSQALLGGQDYVTGVELRVDDIDRAPALAKSLLDKLGGSPMRTLDWQELNHNLFTAVRTQKVVLVIFVTLIILVAALNIIAALTVLVIDKTREVAILKSMGLPPAGAARIFQVAGLSIGGIGTVMGLLLGLLLCAVVSRYGYALDPHVYLIDRLPIRVSPIELVYTVGVTLVICFVATLYPSVRASNLEPVDGLRYE